jgi:glycerophosphoryl diester phosphodiesterase
MSKSLLHTGKKILNGLLVASGLILLSMVLWFLIDGRQRNGQFDLTPPEVQALDSGILQNHPVKVVVHRGATYTAPENTYAAAAECIRLGVDFVEIDVHISMDGVHYIMHDLTLGRTTNGWGPVFLRHSNYIDQLDAGSWYDDKYKGEPVPRLRQYLEWIRGKAGVYLDVKSADLEKVIGMVQELGMENAVFFWFWNDNMAEKFNRLAPDLALKMSAGSFEELTRAIEEFDTDMIECSLDKLTPEMVQLCRDREVHIMTRGGDNSPAHFMKVMQSGVDLVNLGRPDIYLKTLRETMIQQGNKHSNE